MSIIKRKNKLTFRSPHRLDNLDLHHEDNGGNNDGRESRLGNEIKIWGEEEQSDDDEDT